jgi:hypothetical protein
LQPAQPATVALAIFAAAVIPGVDATCDTTEAADRSCGINGSGVFFPAFGGGAEWGAVSQDEFNLLSICFNIDTLRFL